MTPTLDKQRFVVTPIYAAVRTALDTLLDTYLNAVTPLGPGIDALWRSMKSTKRVDGPVVQCTLCRKWREVSSAPRTVPKPPAGWTCANRELPAVRGQNDCNYPEDADIVFWEAADLSKSHTTASVNLAVDSSDDGAQPKRSHKKRTRDEKEAIQDSSDSDDRKKRFRSYGATDLEAAKNQKVHSLVIRSLHQRADLAAFRWALMPSLVNSY